MRHADNFGIMNSSTRGVLPWAVLLLGVTAGCALWLNLSGGNYQDFSPAILIIGYAPALLAILVALFWAGGVRELLGQLLRWRTGAQWYAIALLGPFALTLAATGILVATRTAAPTAVVVLPASAAFLGPLIAGSLGEELGWRGFAQARLQSRLGPLLAALLVGALWTLWHLWPLLTPLGRAETGPADIAQSIVRLVSTAVIYAWLYNRSSLPVVLVAHAGHNLAIESMPPEVIGTAAGSMLVAVLYLAAAIAVVAFDREAWRRRPTASDGAAALERIRVS